MALKITATPWRHHDDEKLKGKVSEEDKSTILSKVEETIKWLDANQDNEKEEYEAKQKELEGICNPIMQKMYAGGAGAGGMPGGMPGGAGMPGGFQVVCQVVSPEPHQVAPSRRRWRPKDWGSRLNFPSSSEGREETFHTLLCAFCVKIRKI